MKLSLQKFIKILLVFTTLIILQDCAYEFSEDSFLEVSQKPPTASISLNDISDNQTFYVPTTIIFNYNGNNKHLLYEIKIYIDNIEIETSTTNSGDFIINTESLEDGIHVLKVEYVFSSGTGSLADISGVEAYIKTEEYNFTVDKSPPETVVMKSADIIDGSIYLSWEPITKLNFDSATLVITNNGSPNYVEITKQELLNLSYNDNFVHTRSCQVQGRIDNDLEYKIRLKNTRGETISNTVGLYIEPFEVEKLIINENQYKIIIPQHNLYDNFDYYLFTDSMGNQYKISSLGGEIVIEEPFKFPSFDAGVLITFYKEANGQDIYRGCSFSSTSFEKQFEYDPSSSYGEFVYNALDNFIYLLRTGSNRIPGDYITIEKLDSETLDIVESKFITTKGANYARDLTFTSTSDLIIDVIDVSYLVDGKSLSVINEWKLSDFGLQTGSIKYRDNTIVIEQDNQLSFYDSTTKELFFDTNKSGYFKISDDGRYFFINNSFFGINNKVVNEIVKINTNDNVNLVEFIDSQSKCVYNSYDGNPIILDLMTGTKSVLSDFTRINIMDYDKASNKLLFVRDELNKQPSYSYVYNLTTTNFKKIEVRTVWSTNENRGYWFQGNKLIYAYGFGFYLGHYINE